MVSVETSRDLHKVLVHYSLIGKTDSLTPQKAAQMVLDPFCQGDIVPSRHVMAFRGSDRQFLLRRPTH